LKAAASHACTGGLQAAAIASAVVLGALAALIFTGCGSPQIPPTLAMPAADLRATAYKRVRVTRLAGGRPDPLYGTCRQPGSERAGDHAHPSSNPHN
jgi:hypothetical protein